jgi:signal transduction histidine kinase/ActR/RegA family two-component response regulator
MNFKGEVLVVDDDEDLLELAALTLTRAGYSVATAADGKAAVDLVNLRDFDLVVLDMMMPVMDGVTAMREIKKISPSVEVVILTAHSSVDTAVETMRLGAFDYVKKPFDIGSLEAMVEKAVEKRRLNELLAAAFRSGNGDGLLETVAAGAAGLLGADEAVLLPAGTGRWGGPAFYCPGGEGPARERLAFCAAGAALAPGAEPFAVVPAADARLKDVPGSAGVAAALFLPLLEDGRLTGALYAGRLPGRVPFGETELRRARDFAPVISLALKNYELSRQLHGVRMQLAQAQKVEALGLVAGQISHDFNNLLAVIMGSVELLMGNLGRADMQRLSREILRMAREAEALVKQLLAFVRRDESPPAPLDLNAALEDIKLIVDKLPGNGVSVEFSLAGGLPKVKARGAHLKLAVINLAANAKSAMPGGGKVSITTRPALPADGPPGTCGPGCVLVEVLDRGEGIKEEDLARIFEPFFTTKPLGAGTGLGLHIARSAARECGGDLTAENRAGGGAVFRLFLPAAG